MFKQLISFDKMITPTIIKILFWVGVGISGIFAISTFVSGFGIMFMDNGFLGFLTIIMGFVIFAVGVLFSRIYCELLIVLFKMHEALASINRKLDQKD